MKLTLTHVFVFIVTFLITLFMIIFYQLIKPEYLSPQYNFSPFPTVKPTDIPDADVANTRLCTDTIKECDPNIGCAMCGDNFECTVVDKNENVIVNGKKVSAGNWCLPKGKNSKGCGTYTGRSVWSERTSGGTTEQQWSCVCLYPDLFGGDTCLTPLACRDTSITSTDQSKNVLKSSDGHVWDPNDPNFDPKGRSPYDKDKDGKPLYSCSCDTNNDIPAGVKFVKLPNDPYRCHAEPCTKDHQIRLWDDKMKMCNCEADPDLQGYFAHSNVTGQCLVANCQWDSKNNKCKCGENEVSLTCESDTMKRTSYTDSNKCPNNPGGSYCSNPCQRPDGKPLCQNGGVPCFGTWVNGSCVPGGSKCTCLCPDTANGEFCEQPCLPKGNSVDKDKANLCCSKKSTSYCNEWISDGTDAGGLICVDWRFKCA